jgi:hypothetical protein
VKIRKLVSDEGRTLRAIIDFCVIKSVLGIAMTPLFAFRLLVYFCLKRNELRDAIIINSRGDRLAELSLPRGLWRPYLDDGNALCSSLEMPLRWIRN